MTKIILTSFISGILISYSILSYDYVESAPALFFIIFLAAAKPYMAS